MATLRETLKIGGDSTEAQRAVDDLNQKHEKQESLLAGIAKGAAAYFSVGAAARAAGEAVQTMIENTQRQIEAVSELQRETRSVLAMAGALEGGERAGLRGETQRLQMQFGEVSPAVIAAVQTEAMSQFAQRPAAIRPAVEMALKARMATGEDPLAILRAAAKAAAVYPEEGANIPGLYNILYRAYGQAPVGSFAEYAGGLPSFLGAAAGAQEPLLDALTFQILATRGATGAAQAGDRVRAGIATLLGQTPESRKWMRAQGLWETPEGGRLSVQQRLARLQELIQGMTPERRQEFLGPYLTSIEAGAAISDAMRGLPEWEAIRGSIMTGGASLEQLAAKAGGERWATTAKVEATGRVIDQIRGGREGRAAYDEWLALLKAQGMFWPGLGARLSLIGGGIEKAVGAAPATGEDVLRDIRRIAAAEGAPVVNINNGPQFWYGVQSELHRALQGPPVPPR